jgi:translation initiation factor IF-3
LSRQFGNRQRRQRGPLIRTNGRIRARQVRVIGIDGSQVGVLATPDAIQLARQHGVDLVEVAPNADPPVCRIIDFGKYRYEQSKKQKEAKKHQHGNKVKEIQLRPNIDPHDFSIKLAHAIDFLCEDMKVKLALRFRGREMAHTEIGFQTVKRFIEKCAPFAQADAPPRLVGRGLSAMLSPKPKNQRAPNPRGNAKLPPMPEEPDDHEDQEDDHEHGSAQSEGEFSNNPFSELDS